MFTWICPKCGREVPPAYTDCPDCAAKAQPPQPTAPPVASVPVPPPPQYQPPAPQYPPQQYPPQYQQPPQQYPPQYQQQPQYQPPPPPPAFYAPPPERTGLAAMPTWLLSILFAVIFGVVVAGIYYLVNSHKESTATGQDAAGTAETSPGASPASGLKNNPLLKQVEVVGLRLTQNKAKKTELRFLLVNHSGGDIQDLAGSVSLRARTSKQDEEPIGACSFKLASLGPYESKDMAAVLNTKLKVYELPDWQKLDAQLQITSP